ncbi:6-phosphofructokinase [Candidatus Woesearchaeota archaeon]|nr:6-phosphofructokinase [Candidatus Woesearchaeota archaeon]
MANSIDTTLLLTNGGHVSPYHGAINAIVNRAAYEGSKVIGIDRGWLGVKKREGMILRPENVRWWSNRAGSLLRNSRDKATLDDLLAIMDPEHTGLIPFGGEDTLGVANSIDKDYFDRTGKHLPIVGWPKTMDNDLSGTDFTLGYPTFVDVASQLTRNAFHNAFTNNGVHFVVAFGRNTDWVVAGTAHYGHADLVIGGEHEYTLQEVITKVQEAYEKNMRLYNGRGFAVVVVAEGVKIKGLEPYTPKLAGEKVDLDDFGHPKLKPKIVALALENAVKGNTKLKPYSEVVEYDGRDSPPIAIDLDAARSSGEAAYDALINGRYGVVAAIRVDERTGKLNVVEVPLQEAVVVRKARPEGMIDYTNMQVTPEFVNYARRFLGQRIPESQARPPRESIPDLIDLTVRVRA